MCAIWCVRLPIKFTCTDAHMHTHVRCYFYFCRRRLICIRINNARENVIFIIMSKKPVMFSLGRSRQHRLMAGHKFRSNTSQTAKANELWLSSSLYFWIYKSTLFILFPISALDENRKMLLQLWLGMRKISFKCCFLFLGALLASYEMNSSNNFDFRLGRCEPMQLALGTIYLPGIFVRNMQMDRGVSARWRCEVQKH